MKGIKIEGYGSALPGLCLTNNDLAKFMETSDEWIKQRTGIAKRHVSTKETTTDLAVEAAKRALEKAGCRPEEIELIIVATVTPDTIMPSVACNVAARLGITRAVAFDITAACTGFIYASEVATSMMGQGIYNKALVIGAETLTQVLNWEDRGSAVLFGDGAGAVVYGRNAQDGVIKFCSHSEGNDCISLPSSPGNKRYVEREYKPHLIDMNGQEVYRFAIKRVPENIQEILEDTPYTLEDIDWFILHQANERIIDAVANKLNIAEDKFIKNMADYANTSAASIPIALTSYAKQFKPGDKLLLTGFGAGLTWGSMLVIWN